MSFPENLSKHRLAVMEMLEEALEDPSKRSALYTRGISMLPFLQERDQIVLRSKPAVQIRIGDVIAYRTGDMLIAHRVVARALERGELYLYEKGDNNLYLTPVAVSRVLGIVAEVVSGRHRRDLGRWHQRWIGVAIAWYGKFTVRVYANARQLGRWFVKPGSTASRAARRLVYFALQFPSRLVLRLARVLP